MVKDLVRLGATAAGTLSPKPPLSPALSAPSKPNQTCTRGQRRQATMALAGATPPAFGDLTREWVVAHLLDVLAHPAPLLASLGQGHTGKAPTVGHSMRHHSGDLDRVVCGAIGSAAHLCLLLALPHIPPPTPRIPSCPPLACQLTRCGCVSVCAGRSTPLTLIRTPTLLTPTQTPTLC